jgi:hypothetical protein
MPTMLAIGAGVGLAKNQLIDAPEAARQRTLQAATARYSPWTGLKAQPVANPNPFAAAIQGGVTGAAMGKYMAASPSEDAADSGQILAANSGVAPSMGANAGTGTQMYDPNNPWASYGTYGNK